MLNVQLSVEQMRIAIAKALEVSDYIMVRAVTLHRRAVLADGYVGENGRWELDAFYESALAKSKGEVTWTGEKDRMVRQLADYDPLSRYYDVFETPMTFELDGSFVTRYPVGISGTGVGLWFTSDENGIPTNKELFAEEAFKCLIY